MKRLHFTVLLFLSWMMVWAKEIPSLPQPPRLVNDYAGVLSNEENNALERKLVTYNDSTSTQICVVIENSLEGDDIFDYSIRLAQGWGIGQKGKNNGILIYVAVQDRKIRIQVGYGAEATVTDAATKQIIEQIIKPAFKQGLYYDGLNEATTTIIKLAAGEYKADAKPGKRGSKLFSWLVVIFIIIFIISRFFRNGGNNYGSRGTGFWTSLFLMNALGGGGRGRSYGDFSSGSGSFGGFGGGGFGGGGSGGDW